MCFANGKNERIVANRESLQAVSEKLLRPQAATNHVHSPSLLGWQPNRRRFRKVNGNFYGEK